MYWSNRGIGFRVRPQYCNRGRPQLYNRVDGHAVFKAPIVTHRRGTHTHTPHHTTPHIPPHHTTPHHTYHTPPPPPPPVQKHGEVFEELGVESKNDLELVDVEVLLEEVRSS